MRRTGRRLLPRLAAAGGGESLIFVANFSAGAGPLYGFSNLGTGHEAGYDHVHQPGGGVGGRDAVDIVLTPVSMGGAPASDMRCGWNGVPNWPTFAQGDALYCQMYLQRFASSPCENAVDGGPYEGKEVIIGGATDGDRIIQAMSDPDVSPNHAGLVSRNISGYPDSTWNDGAGWSEKLILPSAAAFSIQWGVETGPTAGGGGAMKIWVNTDNYASPTRVSGTNLALDASQMFGQPQLWQSINPVLSGSTLTIRVSHISFSTAFVPNHYATM